MKRFSNLRTRGDERAVEAPAMMIVIPALVVLVLALIDIGNMMRVRMVVENLARDTARNAAADGGNYNARTNTIGGEWDDMALKAVFKNGHCRISRCLNNKAATLNCKQITPAGGGGVYTSNVANEAGDIVSCTLYYPYKPINAALLNSVMGLGMGRLLHDFTITESARAETGVNG